MEPSDEDLARAAAGGGREAFSTLLDRHYDRLFAFACRLTGARDRAEDLTQDICLALPAKLKGFEGRARFTTWLYRVAVNAAHDQRRREGARSRASDGWGDWERSRQAVAAEAKDGEAWLRAATAALPDDLRDTVALVLGEDLTQAEAGEILGVSEGTVSWRMSEVKRRLREMRAAEELA